MHSSCNTWRVEGLSGGCGRVGGLKHAPGVPVPITRSTVTVTVTAAAAAAAAAATLIALAAAASASAQTLSYLGQQIVPTGPAFGGTTILQPNDSPFATNTLDPESLRINPMTGALVQYGSPLALDNIKGITWGADFNGQRTLVLVSDNNFGASQFTQFVALSVSPAIPEPGTWALMIGGAAPLGRRLRSRHA